MLETGVKHTFKVVNRSSEKNILEIEDLYGGKYNIPNCIQKDNFELVVVKKNLDRIILSEESCEKTDYKLNDELKLELVSGDETFDQNRVKVFVKDKIGRLYSFLIPKIVYEKVRQTNEINCKLINILGDKLLFRHAEKVEFKYNENQVYKLDVIRIVQVEKYEKFYYTAFARGLYGDSISVLAKKWQYFHKDKVSSIFVKFEKNIEGKLDFVQDYENVIHPFFEYGKEYEFIFLRFDNDSNRIIIRGLDGCTYMTFLPFNLQQSTITEKESIKYVYKGIKSDSGNPILKNFIQFEDIIKKYRALKRLTFDSIYRDSNIDDPLILKFRADYDDFQNLWIISFCEILREKIKTAINNKDFDTSLIFIDVLIQTEKWILESGFLNTFTEARKIETTKAANSEIIKFSKIARALEILLDKKDGPFIDLFTKNLSESNYDEFDNHIDLIVQIFWFQQIHSHVDFDRLLNLVYQIGIKNEDYFKNQTSAEFILLLEKIKFELEKKLLTRVFISSKERNNFYSSNENLKKLIQINVLSAKIYSINSRLEDFHLAIVKIYKLCSFYFSEYNAQLKSIELALSLLKYDFKEFLKAGQLNIHWEHVLDATLFVSNNSAISIPLDSLKQMQLLQSSLNGASVLKGKVVDKNEIGYIIDFEGDNLILPYYTTNRIFFSNEEIEFIVKHIDEKFSTVFVAENKRLIGDDIITNIDDLKVGDVVKGRVKHIENKFVWINLGLVDGRMPINEISKQFIQHPSAILKIGQIIDVKIIAIEEREEKKLCKLSRRAVLEDKTKSIISQQGKEFIATITSIDNDYGLLVELDYGDSCIVPRRNISWNPAFDINQIFDIGEKIKVKIIGYSGDGHIKASALVSDNPFTNIDLIENQEFDAKIFSIYDFEYWSQIYNIEPNETDDDNLYYCPKCSFQSTHRIKNLGFPYSVTKRLRLNKGKGSWSCRYCNYYGEEMIMFWIPSINCTAAFKFGTLSTDKKDILLRKIEHGDHCKIKVNKINNRNGYIDADIITDSFKHKPRIINNLQYNQLILNEIGNCYEHFAFLSNEYKERINYLNFSRYYYGAACNAKSYYLKAYVDFTNIVYSFENSGVNSEEELLIQKVTNLISQIENEELSVEVFPIIETIIKILKILRLYKTDNKDDMFYLLKNSLELNQPLPSINSLSRIMLSQSLLTHEDTSNISHDLNSKIINLLRQTLTLFEYVEIEEEDYQRQKLVYKLMQRGENIDVEFKASIDVPVLSKNTKKEIVRLQHELIKAKQINDTGSCLQIQNKIETLNNVDVTNKLVIKEINMGVVKTLAAFANTSGGYLIIGIDEDENDAPYIMGINVDLIKCKNKDNLKLRFDSLIENHLGDSFNQYIEEFNFITLGDKEVLLIKVGVSENEPIFLKKSDTSSVFFIRRQASTVSLPTEEQYKYFMKIFSS